VAENESDDFVRAKLRVGQVLRDKYRIDRVIGVGGMAAVYAATHRNQKQFAVKVLHTELSYREDIRTRFLREGYAANSVKHPGAVAVLDDDVAEDGAAFLVMELLEGASVEELADRAGGRLAESYAIGIAHQLLDTIASAHAQGIVHRDLKPANLFVTREGQLKVLDFGIARVRDVASGGANVTGTGMLLGTPAFMAPEQALGKSAAIDAQTDLWAVGATLFTVLSGQLVHEGETPSHLMILAATTPARSLAVVAPKASPAIVAVIDRALAFQKADRWPDALAMRDAVRDASLAIFGRLPVRETLSPIFGVSSMALAETRPAESFVAAPPIGTRSAPAVTGPVPRTFSAASNTATPHPVASDGEPPPSLPAGVPRSRPGLWIAAATAGVLVLAGGTAAVIRSMSDAPPASEASSAVGIAPAAPLPAASTTGSEPPSPVVLLPLPAASAAAAPVEPAVAPSPPRAVTAPAVSASAKARATTAAPAAAPPAAPLPPAPTCRVVSFFDADGNKHFRQECH
jgi:eukaryotic-like serine/threonine-protein kinase